MKYRKFGRLRVLKFAGRTKDSKKLWLCQCECGNKKNVRERLWAREYGLKYSTLRQRLVAYGWPIERALTEVIHA